MRARLRLPAIPVTMFVLPGPELVLAACSAGIAGTIAGEYPAVR